VLPPRARAAVVPGGAVAVSGALRADCAEPAPHAWELCAQASRRTSKRSDRRPLKDARVCLVAQTWHNEGMARVRVSTTVDEKLLATARSTLSPSTDAALLDEALATLLDRHRGAEIDAAYAAYDAHPPEEADAWGDLASFREAAKAS
jgi:hypothetical protein